MKSKQGCIQLIRLAIKVHFGAARKGKTGKAVTLKTMERCIEKHIEWHNAV